MIFRKNEQDRALDELINSSMNELAMTAVDSEEHPKLMSALERLQKLKASKSRKPISTDTIAIVAGNLLGILIIVAYEHAHVMTSKSYSQLQPLRAKLPET